MQILHKLKNICKYTSAIKQQNEKKCRQKNYPPAEQRPRARRSSKVVGSTDVRSEADKPAAPNPPKVPKNYDQRENI
jgi:hypothetical protein